MAVPESDNPYEPSDRHALADAQASAWPEVKLWRVAMFLFCLAAVIVQPAFTAQYFEWNLDHGAYPPHADSIAIPLAGNIILWIFWAPILSIVFWIAFWRLASVPRLLAWNSNKKWKSSLISLLCLGCVALMAEAAWEDIAWRNWIGLAYTLWWIGIWLLVRAALLTPKVQLWTEEIPPPAIPIPVEQDRPRYKCLESD